MARSIHNMFLTEVVTDDGWVYLLDNKHSLVTISKILRQGLGLHHGRIKKLKACGMLEYKRYERI